MTGPHRTALHCPALPCRRVKGSELAWPGLAFGLSFHCVALHRSTTDSHFSEEARTSPVHTVGARRL